VKKNMPKKRLDLGALKAAIGQMRAEYAFSERRAYESRRSDERLRTRLAKLAREKPRFGIGDCMCCCGEGEKE